MTGVSDTQTQYRGAAAAAAAVIVDAGRGPDGSLPAVLRPEEVKPAGVGQGQVTRNHGFFEDFIGSSDSVRRIYSQVGQVAPTLFTVIISGETGTGKELVAKAIHDLSPRSACRFVAVDCGSIPETIIESELFGHEKGAFTGAGDRRLGKLELASGGTIFLDEIGNLPYSMQAKLLRALQEREICRVGGETPVKVDIRIVAATNANMASMVTQGAFREDLYHRLNEFSIEIPSLRERREDIICLAKRFLDATNAELDKSVHGFSEKALEVMLGYNWPGNVRELRNVIRRGVLVAEDVVEPQHFGSLELGGGLATEDGFLAHFSLGKGFNLHKAVQESASKLEKAIIVQVLSCAGWNKARAARILGIDYKTLHVKVKNYGISPTPARNDR